jgi:hypothetical protein
MMRRSQVGWLFYLKANMKYLLLSMLLLANASLPVMLSSAASALDPDIPRLDWQPRSDWINVQKDIVPPAVGDGKADDTAAIQAALNRGVQGKTIYLPPGTYRIVQTLVFKGPGKGSAVIGQGRQTRLVWDGTNSGRMFWSDSMAHTRYIGLSWDGRGKAAIGFDHAAKKQFETEVQHEDEAFRNFTAYGIRVGNEQKRASAEILYHNCLFENCGTAIGLLTFNDYDNTIDGCEFRRCGTGVLSHKSNFYARNCHFEYSREADFIVGPEHGCSIRRCTSVGSKRFVSENGSIAPLTLQDCHVANWTDRDAAVYLNRNAGPVLIFDCVFTHASSNRFPIQVAKISEKYLSQKLLLCNNRPAAIEALVTGISPEKLYIIPPGREAGVVTAAGQHFLQQNVAVPGKVFDAVRDFGAKADGRTDDSTAIQSAVDAARQYSHGAIAYLPTGRYVVSKTLQVTGRDYTLGGSGFLCGLVWRGKAGEPFITVSNVQNVTLANFSVGHHDLGPMKHGDDILVTSPPKQPCQLILDEVYSHGAFQKAPDRHGIHFDHLPAGSIIDARHVQGNIRITDSSCATLLFRTSYEGTLTIEGTSAPRDGLIGFLTRAATISRPALRVFDNQSVVMSDFYNEQSDQVAAIEGATGQPAGYVTIQGPKVHTLTQEPILDVRDYAGRIYCGQSEFYLEPAETKFQVSGTRPVQLILAGDFWYRNKPAFELNQAAKLTLLGNSGVADSALTPEALAALSAALDDLRRLGKLDYSLWRGRAEAEHNPTLK